MAFEQIVKRPLAAFVNAIEMLGHRAKGRQTIDGIVSRIAHTLSQTPGGRIKHENKATAILVRDVHPEAVEGTVDPGSALVAKGLGQPGRTQTIERADEGDSRSRDEERKNQRDTNLNDDTLKLVRYKILFVKRGYEATFPEKEELIGDDLSEAAFTNWKMAEFIQHLDEIEIPRLWREKNYPKLQTGDHPERMIHSLPEEDKKYLRVFYEVLARYPRYKRNHRRRQLSALKSIRDAIRDLRQ